VVSQDSFDNAQHIDTFSLYPEFDITAGLNVVDIDLGVEVLGVELNALLCWLR